MREDSLDESYCVFFRVGPALATADLDDPDELDELAEFACLNGASRLAILLTLGLALIVDLVDVVLR